jgi:hypothetical protein
VDVDPSRGIGRALFAALSQLAQSSGHQELASARLILLAFSGAGSLVARLAGYAPDRVIAAVPMDAGHFDPLGIDTVLFRQSARSASIDSHGLAPIMCRAQSALTNISGNTSTEERLGHSSSDSINR